MTQQSISQKFFEEDKLFNSVFKNKCHLLKSCVQI